MVSSTVRSFFIAVTFVLCAFPTFASTRDPGSFYGFWESQEPAGDTCVFNVKRGNRISSFYTGSATSLITQGTWELKDDRLIARWETGHHDVFTLVDSGALQRAAYRPGQEIASEPAYQTRAVKIDPRVPGSLGVKRDDASWEEQANSSASNGNVSQSILRRDVPIRNDFNGYWKVRQNTGGFMGIGSSGREAFYLHLLRNGTAQVVHRRWDDDNATVTGRWSLEDDTAIIEWSNGHRDVLSESADGSYSLQAFTTGSKKSGRPDSVMPAARSTASEAAQIFGSGDVRLFTMSDIRGFWIPEDRAPTPSSSSKQQSGPSQYIHIEGWGRASRYPVPAGSKGRGEWRLFTDRVVVTWDNGAKDVIRISARGWEQDSFAPGVSTSSSPTQTLRVHRVDADHMSNLSAAR